MRRRGKTTTRGLSVRVTAGIVAAGLVVGGLAGCTGGKREPSWTPTPWTPEETVEPSPTPTPTPSVPAPERPAAMGEVNDAGAEAVARYFLDLYAYVYATGDLEAWRELSHPECIFCTSVITNVEEQVAAGHRSEGGEVTITSLTTTQVSADFFGVIAVVDQTAGKEFDDEGALVDQSPQQSLQLSVALAPTDSGWVVRGVQVDPAPAS